MVSVRRGYGLAALSYCGTHWAFHIIIRHFPLCYNRVYFRSMKVHTQADKPLLQLPMVHFFHVSIEVMLVLRQCIHGLILLMDQIDYLP